MKHVICFLILLIGGLARAADLPLPLLEKGNALPEPPLGFESMYASWLPDPLHAQRLHMKLIKQWQFPTKLSFAGSHLKLFIVGETIYMAGSKGQVIAVDRNKGKLLWRVNTHLPLSSGPHVAEGLIALGSHDGHVIVLDLQQGTTVWKKALSNEILASPVITKQAILVKTSDGHLWAFSNKNGHTLWHYVSERQSLRLRGDSAPLTTSQHAFVGFSNGHLLSFDLVSGQVEWRALIAGPKGFSDVEQLVDINADLVLQGSTLYVVSYQGSIAALNAYTGEFIWRAPLSAYSDLALDGTRLYVTDATHQLWAFDQKTGRVLWHDARLIKKSVTAPVVLPHLVIVGDSNGYLHGRSSLDGHPLGHIRVGKSTFVTPPLAIANEIYTLNTNGLLMSFKVNV